MSREPIYRDALLEIINEHLAMLEDCRNLHATDVMIDPEQPHGANWSVSGWRRSGHNTDLAASMEKVAGFMCDLYARYDLRE